MDNVLGIRPLTVLSLFSGAGGLELGARIVGGFRTVCYVERDPYAQAVLQTNIRRGWLDDAPIWDDVTTFDGKPWRGLVDVVAGGFPCQDVSHAGKRGGVKEGTRSGLWGEFARIIRQVRPRYALIENVPGLLSLGFGRVLGDLAEMGFDAQWYVLSAAEVGATHRRDRVFILAYSKGLRRRSPGRHESKKDGIRTSTGQPLAGSSGMAHSAGEQDWRKESVGNPNDSGTGGGVGLADAFCPRCKRSGCSGENRIPIASADNRIWTARPDEGQFCWEPPRLIEPRLGRSPHGLADRANRLRCIGNGVVPQQSAPAWQRIKDLAG